MYPNYLPTDPKGVNGTPSERLVIVVGDNGLTLRFIRNLTSRFGYRVVALIAKGPAGSATSCAGRPRTTCGSRSSSRAASPPSPFARWD
ncbi:hypothetical protein GCM10029992_04880 [Glycomyces albus]